MTVSSSATSGFGTLLKMGDGGIGAGTQASRTIGTSNQQVIFKALVAGTAGNSKTVAIVVSGVSTAFALSVTADAITVTSATDGSSAATTTVNELLYQLMQNSTFVANWQATRGAGNGTGVVVAAASAALSGGAEGTELFATIAEVKSINGPSMQSGITEKTHMESPNNTKEFLPTLIDPGELTFNANFLPANTTQTNVKTAMSSRTQKNFKLVWTDSLATTWSFAGYVTGMAPSAEMEGPLMLALTIKLTSFPT